MSGAGSDAPLPTRHDAETTIHVQAAIKGDATSVEWIFRRFGPLLRAQAAWRLGRHASDQDIEDVLADAWLVALPRLRELAPREGRLTPVILAFFATTIRWLANGRLRRRLRRAAEASAVPLDSEVAGAEVRGTLSRILQDEMAAVLRDALDHLDDAERTVVILRGVEGLPNHDVAEELGQHPNTTSRHYNRALAHLRSLLHASIFDDLVDE